MSWESAISEVRPHVVRIQTQNSSGTGFLTLYNHDLSWCGIATAAHVVDHADKWQQPIKVENDVSGRFLNGPDRVILIDHSTDSAVVLFFKGDLQLPQVPIALMPMGHPLGIGSEVGWLGYPSMNADMLCFFAGAVSAQNLAQKSYLIDGVAIHGVSGGPVFHRSVDSSIVEIIGCMVAYHPNLAAGTPLPGLSRAQDVSHFHGVIQHVKSIDEANARKKEFEDTQGRGQAGTHITSTASEP
jgi:hypothetical protein